MTDLSAPIKRAAMMMKRIPRVLRFARSQSG